MFALSKIKIFKIIRRLDKDDFLHGTSPKGHPNLIDSAL
jgi:hypothetical protein